MRRFTFFLFLIIALGFGASAQIIVTGTISNETNNEPIIGAFISAKSFNQYSVSEEDGTYLIILPPPEATKKVIINVNALGFVTINQPIELIPADDGSTINQNFKMEVDPLTLKDVIVTANKVEEELQDVPIAVTSINAFDLNKRNISNTDEAFNSIPNIVTDSYVPSVSTFSLRGMASDFTSLGIESSIGFYIDEVFYSRSFHFNQTLMDIDRVEVLRGPQGTLFGKNTVGGVLHVLSESPKMGNSAALELNAGNFQYLSARAKGNLEIVPDKLAMRVTGTYRKREGWLLEKNEEVGDENGIQFYGGRLSFLYKPTERIEILLKGNYSKDDKSDFTIDYKVPDDGINRVPVDESETDHLDREVSQNEPSAFHNRETYGAVGKIDFHLNNALKLTAISAYNNSDAALIRDFDASTANVGILGWRSGIENFSQEFRISSPRQNRKLFYIGGLYYLKEKLTNQDTLVGRGDMGGIFTNIFHSLGIPLTFPDNYFEAGYNDSQIESESLAAYLSGSFEFTERIRFNAGVRYNYEKKDMAYWQDCICLPPTVSPISPAAFLIAPPVGSPDAPIVKDTTNQVLTFNFGFDFKTTDKTLLYFNFSRGFKASGFNTAFSPDTDPHKIAFMYRPEFINSYEVGLKIRTANRYQFNAAAFVTDFQDKQEIISAGNSVIVRNAEAVQGQGFEAEFTGIWNKFLKTEASIGFLNMKYRDFPFTDPNDPLGGTEINLSGNQALKAPSMTFNFSPEFHTKIGKEIKALFRTDFYFVGKTYNDIYNTESLARAPNWIINARLSFASKNDRFRISIWGKNLTDETYIQHAWSFIFGDLVTVNPPRMIGIELRTAFF